MYSDRATGVRINRALIRNRHDYCQVSLHMFSTTRERIVGGLLMRTMDVQPAKARMRFESCRPSSVLAATRVARREQERFVDGVYQRASRRLSRRVQSRVGWQADERAKRSLLVVTIISIQDCTVSAITGRRYEESLALLRRAKWNVKTAIVMQKRRLTYHDAKTRLRASEN
jgi:hypothetical protein